MDEETLNRLTERIIGCAIEVHRNLGPGLLEAIYESALCIEMELAGLAYERQKPIQVMYKGHALGEHRLDIVVEDAVILELKSVERFDRVFEAQILSYLRMTELPIGLLINFNTRLLKDGIHRYRL
jgi:GxxExxY protein